ncbi:MAG: ABC transporter permease [Mucispirillum sp.]|nr:ABC transporter permease [Mucispirillum sp.]
MSIRRIKAISYKEFIHLFRDIRSLMVIILVPVILLVLFGYALKLDVENVSIGVLDFSNSERSKEYIAGFDATSAFNVNYHLSNYEEAEYLLDTNKIKMILVIKSDFDKELNTQYNTKIQAIIDGSDITTASSIMNYVTGITAEYNRSFIEYVLRNNQINVAFGTVIPEIRYWFNEDMRSVNYLFPGLVAIIMSVVAGFLTSLTISREWETGTMEQLIPTPVTEGEVITGKLITYFLIGLIDVIIYILMGEFLFHVPLMGNSLLVFLFATIFLMCMLSFGIFVSIVMKSQLASSQVTTTTTMLPAFLLSGFVFDINNMPVVIQWITYLFPARYFVDILRGLYLKGVGIEYLYVNAGFLIFYSVILLVLCRLLFKLRA